MSVAWWNTTWTVGQNVDKSAVKSGLKTYVPAVLTLSELRALTTDGLRCAIVAGQVYLYDSADTTTADDGELVIVSADAKRFKRTTGAAGGIALLGVLEAEGDLPEDADAGDAYVIDGEIWISDGDEFANAGPFVGPSGQGLNWAGAWVTATPYVIDDTVQRSGSSYVCKSDHTSGATTAPGTGASWTDVWDLLISKGDQGDPGTDPGVRFLFASSTSMGDPSAGNVRFNHASFASVTAIAMSDLCGEVGNPDISAWVLALDDSTSTVRGTLVYKKRGAPENFAIYNVTGASTDNSGWTQLAVTHLVSNGSFSASDVLSVQFYRTGDKGSDGVGVGDVTGPASSVDARIAVFSGTGGKTLVDGGQTIAAAIAAAVASAVAAAGDVVGPGTVTANRIAVFSGTTGKLLAEGAKTIAELQTAATTTTVGPVEKATAGEVRASTADKFLDAEVVKDAAAYVALTDAATVAVDWSLGENFSLTAAGNRTIGNPTNAQPGTWRSIQVQGDSGTDRSLTFGDKYLGELPIITDCDNAKWYELYIKCHTTTHFSVSAKVVKG